MESSENHIPSKTLARTEAPAARIAPSSSRPAIIDEICELEVIVEEPAPSFLLGSSSGCVGVGLASDSPASKAE